MTKDQARKLHCTVEAAARMFFETIEREGKTMRRFELVEDRT